MGGLNSIAGLNKVGVDYRPDVGPSAHANGAQKVRDDDNIIHTNDEIIDTGANDVQPEKGTGRSVLQQLGVLLLHAAKRSVAEDAALKAATVGEALRAGKLLGKRQLDRLQQLATDASEKLKALDKFTGMRIAKSLAKDNATGRLKWRETGPNRLCDAARAVKDALDAHKALSTELYNLNKKLVADGKAGEALLDQLTELQFQCDRRETEINSVVLRMFELVQKPAGGQRRNDPEIAELLDANFLDLMPREALHMHGTADAMELMQKSLGEQMRPVAEKLDAFAADHGKSLSAQEIAELQTSLETMKNAVGNVRRNGIRLDGLKIDVDKSILAEMEAVLGDVGEKIAAAKATFVGNIRAKFIPEARNTLLMTASVPTQLRVPGSKFDQYAGLVDEFLKAIEAHGNGTMTAARLDGETRRLSLAARDLKLDTLSLNTCGFDDEQAATLIKVSSTFRLVAAQFKELLWNSRRFLNREDNPVTAGDVRRLLLGEIGVSSVVEAAARGFEARDADPEADEANIADSRPLDAGKAGTTYLLTTKTGGQLVFKPDLEGRVGLNRLAAGGSAYRPGQNTANLNLATVDTAKAFHCEDLVVKYSVGSHKGQFGVFMEKAPGYPGRAFERKSPGRKGEDGVSPRKLAQEVPDARERDKVNGQFARKLNRLQWLDIVTGQGDRHHNNYFIRIDPVSHDVEVKGIDNDASFPESRVGVQKYKLSEAQTDAFERVLLEVCTTLYGRGHARTEAARCHLSGAIEEYPVDGTLTIDMARAGDVHEIGIALARVVGTQSIALPDAIDEEFYDELMKFDDKPEAVEGFIATIAPRLSVEAMDATRKRLLDAVEHAKRLRRENKVYTAADWEDPKKLDALTPYRDSLQITGSGNRTVEVQYDTATADIQSYLIDICPSYYKRDGMDTLFAAPPKKP